MTVISLNERAHAKNHPRLDLEEVEEAVAKNEIKEESKKPRLTIVKQESISIEALPVENMKDISLPAPSGSSAVPSSFCAVADSGKKEGVSDRKDPRPVKRYFRNHNSFYFRNVAKFEKRQEGRLPHRPNLQ